MTLGRGDNFNPMAKYTKTLFMDGPVQEESIRVCLRLRPINKFELNRRSINCVNTGHTSDKDSNINSESKKYITVNSPLQGGFKFAFDKIFPEKSTQVEVYQHAVAPLAVYAMEGYSCALIAYGQTGSGKTHTIMGGGEQQHHPIGSSKIIKSPKNDEQLGMIQQFVKDVFRLINDSPPSAEYILRCSFVEIYLERVLDLLNPTNRSIRIASSSYCGQTDSFTGEENRKDEVRNEGIRLLGASEACCFDESDVISLLVRGNACRTVSSTKLNTDSSRSHAIFVLKIEQKDNITGISKVSHVQMIDMAGSELALKTNSLAAATGMKDDVLHQEATMINKSISLLHTVVKTVVENQNLEKGKFSGVVEEGVHEVPPHRQSKLTHLLQDVFGGNCRTSVILTASPASYNITETIRTAKFGQLCRSVQNYIQPNVEMSPLDYRKLLNDSQKKQGFLVNLVNELAAECFQLKQDAKKPNFDESQYDGPLWKTIESILVDGVSPVVNKKVSFFGGQGQHGEPANVVNLQEELSKTREDLQRSFIARQKIENMMAERQSEVSVLRMQNDIYASEKKKYFQELIAMKNEIRLLTQQTQEVEHNLRTSQFREFEATVFLRQFRRFYRRLLRNKAHQGTGKTSDVIERVPGVPDLNDLIDVDSLLLEAGLIEDSELHDDTAMGAYRPSSQALTRSSEAANNAWKEAELLGKVTEIKTFDRLALRVVGGYKLNDPHSESLVSAIPNGQSISHRQQLLGTPAGRLATMRERELERDLLSATERCIDLQVALNEEKSNVELLSNRAGNASKLKYAQESTRLKQQLDKKTHDLQAIIWKMNELHLINKTYNEKMSNREQHVTYLEENLMELQSANRRIILERQEAEGTLRAELDNVRVLVDAMTVPLWQFGECGISGRTLTSRIRLPVCGGDGIDADEIENDFDGVESLESEEESLNSLDDEDEEESEYEDELDAPAEKVPVAKAVLHMQEASTQTDTSSDEKATMTDSNTVPVHPQAPIHSNFNGDNAPQSDIANNHLATTSPTIGDFPSQNLNQNYLAPASAPSEEGSLVAKIESDVSNVDDDKYHDDDDYNDGDDEYLFSGAMSPYDQPRRFVYRFGNLIRPAVLKETSLASTGTNSQTEKPLEKVARPVRA